MTNWDYYKDKLDTLKPKDPTLYGDYMIVDNELKLCNAECERCLFGIEKKLCDEHNLLKWLAEERTEKKKIDWSKIKINKGVKL